MTRYQCLKGLMAGVRHPIDDDILSRRIAPRLVQIWLDDYRRRTNQMDVVETTMASFHYMFDVSAERLIAAWGISRGRVTGLRDKSRMAGHPLGDGPLYHRGHAIPHLLGGPTDINLVPQLGRINVGPFRELERRAAATPGVVYFTYWNYRGIRDSDRYELSQTPVAVEQGLLMAGRPPLIRYFQN